MLPGCYNRNVGNKAMQAVLGATKVLQEVLQLENKAVAAEPAVALEALPPATFSATFATFASSYIRCYIRYIRLH